MKSSFFPPLCGTKNGQKWGQKRRVQKWPISDFWDPFWDPFFDPYFHEIVLFSLALKTQKQTKKVAKNGSKNPLFDHFLTTFWPLFGPLFWVTHIGGLLNLNKPVKKEGPKMTQKWPKMTYFRVILDPFMTRILPLLLTKITYFSLASWHQEMAKKWSKSGSKKWP